jgi:protein-S-isoprenylcysteine O-methyltransferase Ste14
MAYLPATRCLPAVCADAAHDDPYEEKHLTRTLGDEYSEYQRRVPRYLLKLGSTSRSAT